jgi:hypothetical protein
MAVQGAARHLSWYKVGDDMFASFFLLFIFSSLPCWHLMYFIVPRFSFRTKQLFHHRSFVIFVAAAFVFTPAAFLVGAAATNSLHQQQRRN